MALAASRSTHIPWMALTGAALGAMPAAAAEVSYGPLAPGAISYSEMAGVDAEICRDHLFDPSFASMRLPAGYRLVPAAEVAKGDSGVAALLARDARLGSRVVGSLCFLSAGRFIVDGVRVHPPGATPMAFWWARAEPVPGAARDARMQGKAEWLQLASWYARGTDQARIAETDPMARFADLEMAQLGPNHWRMRLALASEIVTAEVRGDGQRVQRKAPQPGFVTVPFTGDSAAYFTVFTYFGHHHQGATGSWQAKGSGVFSGALAVPGEAEAFGTFFQDGWQARAGLYKVEPADEARRR